MTKIEIIFAFVVVLVVYGGVLLSLYAAVRRLEKQRMPVWTDEGIGTLVDILSRVEARVKKLEDEPPIMLPPDVGFMNFSLLVDQLTARVDQLSERLKRMGMG